MKKVQTIAFGSVSTNAIIEDCLVDQYIEDGIANQRFGLPKRIVVNPETLEETTLPAEYTIEITDVTAEHEAEQSIRALIADGEKNRRCCDQILVYVTGYNKARNLSIEDTTTLQATYADLFSLLLAGRVDTSKAIITALEPDGLITTQAMKDAILTIITKNGF